MPNIHMTLPLQNESSSPVKVILEPLCHFFIVQPRESIEIHATFDDETTNTNFTIAPGDACLTVYAPGEIAGFVACYAMRDGVRLEPNAG